VERSSPEAIGSAWLSRTQNSAQCGSASERVSASTTAARAVSLRVERLPDASDAEVQPCGGRVLERVGRAAVEHVERLARDPGLGRDVLDGQERGTVTRGHDGDRLTQPRTLEEARGLGRQSTS
jgi:hypothetical protein